MLPAHDLTPTVDSPGNAAMKTCISGVTGAASRSIATVAVLVSALALQTACQPDEPVPEEPYEAVLERLVTELDLDYPVAVHPLVGRLEPRRDETVFDFTSFYSADSVPVFDYDPPRFVECAIAVSGACELWPGEVTVVLSESVDIGNDALMVVAFVTDLRKPDRVQTYFRASARKGRHGWTIYRLERL